MKILNEIIENEIDKLSMALRTPKDIHSFARTIAKETIKIICPEAFSTPEELKLMREIMPQGYGYFENRVKLAKKFLK